MAALPGQTNPTVALQQRLAALNASGPYRVAAGAIPAPATPPPLPGASQVPGFGTAVPWGTNIGSGYGLTGFGRTGPGGIAQAFVQPRPPGTVGNQPTRPPVPNPPPATNPPPAPNAPVVGVPRQFQGLPQAQPYIQQQALESGQLFAPHLSVGITKGPVYSPQQISHGLAQLTAGSAPRRSFGNPELDRLYGDNMGAVLDQARVDFGRDVAGANAKQELSAQEAAARSGSGLLGYTAGRRAQGLERQAVRQNAILSLLSQLV